MFEPKCKSKSQGAFSGPRHVQGSPWSLNWPVTQVSTLKIRREKCENTTETNKYSIFPIKVAAVDVEDAADNSANYIGPARCIFLHRFGKAL